MRHHFLQQLIDLKIVWLIQCIITVLVRDRMLRTTILHQQKKLPYFQKVWLEIRTGKEILLNHFQLKKDFKMGVDKRTLELGQRLLDLDHKLITHLKLILDLQHKSLLI